MPRNPDERAPLEELEGALRSAVEQARAEPAPAEAVLRALDRAQRLGPPPRRRWRWSAENSLSKAGVAAGIAAVLLVGLGIWAELYLAQAGGGGRLPVEPVQLAQGGGAGAAAERLGRAQREEAGATQGKDETGEGSQ